MPAAALPEYLAALWNVKSALAEDQSVNRRSFIRKAAKMTACEPVFVAKKGHDCLEQLKGLPRSRMYCTRHKNPGCSSQPGFYAKAAPERII